MTLAASVEASEGPPALGTRALILLLGACSAMGPISSLMLLPALPSIRDDFGATTAGTQAIVSVFLFSFAVGIPFVGPLSDRYGRRPLILGGLAVFAAGSALAAWAPTLEVLIGARVVQALGCAANLTVARAVIGDLFHDWRLPRALAQLTMAMMLGTTISPWLGGVITERLGWHAPFLMLLGIAIVVGVAVWRLLPETRVLQAGTMSFGELGRSSVQVMRNPLFVGCAIDAGVIYAVYLCFISIAPYIMSEMLHRPATDFGLYVMLLSAGYFLGNLYVSHKARTGNMERIARFGSQLQAASAIVALGFVLAGFTHPAFWFLPMLPLAFAQGLSLPHVTATAVRLAPGYAGVASSLIGFTQQAIAALAVQATGFFATDTPVPVLALCAALSLISLGALLLPRDVVPGGYSMKLGLNLGYWGSKPIDRFIELAVRAEELGFDIVCTAEAYGSDVFTPLAAIAARTARIRLGTSIMQISARTPTCAATTAMTLDHISGGRLCLGVGVSGPQVVEGWYGQPFRKPLERTREWLAIFRQVVARESPVAFGGQQFSLPYQGEHATGLGKPLMSITHPLRKQIPLFLGAEGPKNVELAIREFDGWFPIFMPPERFDVFGEQLRQARPGFEILSTVDMTLSDERATALKPLKRNIALYVGGMGSKEENFHKRMVERSGYGEAAQKIQDLWLAGRQPEAVAAVPDELAEAISLVGTPAQVRERLAAWRQSPVTTLMISRSATFEETVRNMEFLAAEVPAASR